MAMSSGATSSLGPQGRAMFADDVTSRREPKTVAIGARRKEWLEDLVLRGLVHAASRIGNRNHNEAAGPDPDLPNPQRVCYFPHADLNLDGSWLVHRFARVVA